MNYKVKKPKYGSPEPPSSFDDAARRISEIERVLFKERPRKKSEMWTRMERIEAAVALIWEKVNGRIEPGISGQFEDALPASQDQVESGEYE